MIGKLFGAILGFSLGGLPGALLGLLGGHVLDRASAHALHGGSPAQRQRIQASFFTTVFTLLGYLAKADGRVSEAEIGQTEQLMAGMGLTADHRKEAIRLFKIGAAPDFDPDRTLAEFRLVCGQRPQLVRWLLIYLFNVALADGELHAEEEQVLRRVAQQLGIPPAAFEQFLRMIRAQDTFRGGRPTGPGDLEQAYQALGVSSDASDAEVKKAYRRLISENHPDKLIGRGVPEDMVQAATERSQEIQTAYDLVRKSRGN